MGLFERLERIAKAEMNYAKANHSLENPEAALNKCIKDMELAIVRLRKSIAYASAAKNRLEEKYNYSLSEVIRWQQRAELALSAGDENLAREALLRKNYHQENVAQLKTQMELNK